MLHTSSLKMNYTLRPVVHHMILTQMKLHKFIILKAKQIPTIWQAIKSILSYLRQLSQKHFSSILCSINTLLLFFSIWKINVFYHIFRINIYFKLFHVFVSIKHRGDMLLLNSIEHMLEETLKGLTYYYLFTLKTEKGFKICGLSVLF